MLQKREISEPVNTKIKTIQNERKYNLKYKQENCPI